MLGNKKRQGRGEVQSTNGWMTTFSDLCTLLLTFFVLLFSLSTMDDKKLKIAFQNFDGSSGILFYREYREISRPREVLIEGLNEILGEKVTYGESPGEQELSFDSNYFNKPGGSLEIKILDDGLKLVFGESLLFTAGSIEVNPQSMKLLKKVGRFISISGYQAYIDGHTDNVPVQTEDFISNEELSIARALNVKDYLVGVENVPSDLICITGYGDSRPISNNDQPQGRAMNRRVEIILKNQKYF